MMMPKSIRFVLFVFLFMEAIQISWSINNGLKLHCLENERNALLSFRLGLINGTNRLSSWVGQDCCKWEGVACDNFTGHVVKLDLSVKLGLLKAQLRELEGDLVKTLAVKTSKEAKHIMVSDSISTAKARTEDLKKSLHDLKTRKDEYAAIMSQQLQGLATLEEKANQGIKEKEEIQEVISWYNRVLGLRVESGRGVKFIFKNINVKDPNEEYSFTVRCARETYTLINCDPHLDGTKELIQELNQTNGFYEFVRTMREKFQAAASNGFRPQSTSTQPDSHTSTQPDSCTVSVSAPASSVSVDEKGKHGNDNVFHVQAEEVDRTPEKVNRGRKGRSPGSRSPKSTLPIRRTSHMKVSSKEVSPGSASSVRRSSRLKAKTSGK